MTIAVFSDSHGNTERMCAAIATHQPDAVAFLGDVVADVEKVRRSFPALPFHVVRGNCDHGAPGYEDSLLLELEGVRIFCAHGHNHGVKWSMGSFCNSVWCAGAQLGLYGHTHQPKWREERGIQILNPGSIGSAQQPTYALVELDGGNAHCRILDCPKS